MPYLIYLLINTDESNIFVLMYDILIAIGISNNVFVFIIFILFNKVYKQLFFEYMGCKEENVSRPESRRHVIHVSVL